MIGLDSGFSRINLVSLVRLRYRLQRVTSTTGVRLAPVRVMVPKLVLQYMVTILLGAYHLRVSLTVGSFIIGPEILPCVGGLLLLYKDLHQQHLQLGFVFRVGTIMVNSRVFKVVPREGGQVVGLMVRKEVIRAISMQLQQR